MSLSVEEIKRIKERIDVLNNQSVAANAKIEMAEQKLKTILEKYNVKTVEELQAKVQGMEAEVEKLIQSAQGFIAKRTEELNKIQPDLNGVY